jgi:hypothetical protein
MEDKSQAAALAFQLGSDPFCLKQNRINLPVSTQSQSQNNGLLAVGTD